MIPIPRSYGEAFLMPVAKVMKLYRKYSGTNYCATTQTPAYLDVTASRKGNTLFAHVVNTHRTSPVKTTLSLKGETIASIKVHEIPFLSGEIEMTSCPSADNHFAAVGPVHSFTINFILNVQKE
ncbi:hypothetical protein [Cyclobacterium salsum]|uniref:hypothetical protein n=1 Tax=Cyclobacterium salsum TaxID=2666329 RepID=UPI001390BCCC|nr:hypothetical protein [Cyclobacterium salsum]